MRAKRTGVTAALSLVLLAVSPAMAGASPSHWIPPRQLPWYWQLTGTVNNSYAVAAYDIDGFDNSASEVSTLHSTGKRAICYIDAGTWENWRPDAGSFPQSVLGSGNGWPGEKWLDIRQLSTLEPIITARLQMCAQKGYDAVEPDNIDGYQNSTGFPLTAQDQLNYNEWIATESHALGLTVFQKNDPDQAGALQPHFDGVIDEQCNEYSECSSFKPYLNANKPVLDAEYSSGLYPGFCTADSGAGIMGALYGVSLDGSTYKPCFGLSSSTTPIPPATTPPPTGAPSPTGTPRPHRRHSSKGRSGRTPVLTVALAGRSGRRGSVAVRLTCRHVGRYCAGTVKLALPAGRRGAKILGSHRFHIARTRTIVVIRLSGRALRAARHAGSVAAMIEVTARDPAGRTGSAHRRVRLHLPRLR